MPRIRMPVSEVLQSPETRKACEIYEVIDAGLEVLDTLPVPLLKALRDYVADQTQKQTGARADFWHAFAIYLRGPLNDARTRDLREAFGLYRDLS